jgi:hypothetical protein
LREEWIKLRFAQLIGVAAAVALVAGVPSAGGTVEALPLVGVNYSNFGPGGCGDGGPGIVAYGNTGRRVIRQELAAMRASGIQTLRTFIWNMHDASGQTWGAVSSAGGRLGPTETQNLINYVSDVRNLGFTRLEVAFSPQGANDPIGYPQNNYDPSLFDENWQVIRYVRGIVKQYGPIDTRFDLLNEGAASDYLATKAQLEDYVARLYSNYVDAFGNADVTVSSIVGANDQSRIANLIDTLRSTGRPLPTWFEVHSYSADVLDDLRATDATLTAKGLSQPITLGETYYDDPSAASAVATFAATSSRPLDEVLAWPLQRGSTCQNWSVSAPYKADAFITALTGSSPPNQIAVTLGPGRTLALHTPYGQPVIALETGTYSFAVADRSRADNFHITGPAVNRATGRRFRGNRTWTLRLKPGTYRYRSDRPNSHLKGSFAVLRAG